MDTDTCSSSNVGTGVLKSIVPIPNGLSLNGDSSPMLNHVIIDVINKNGTKTLIDVVSEEHHHQEQQTESKNTGRIVSNGSSVNGGQSSSTTTATSTALVDTKVIFYEMMSELIRSQLDICDRYLNDDCNAHNNNNHHEHESSSNMENNGNKILNASITYNNKQTSVFPKLKDSLNRPYMLQPSMFPFMYPTVFFTADNDNISAVPLEVRPFLRWKITSIMANTMRSIVMRSGYKLMPMDRNPKNKTFNNWNAIWCKHLRVNEFQLVGYYQRINHFPGSFNFGRKDRLWINLKNKMEKYGADNFGNFHPPTFILPHDYSSLVAYWRSNDSILTMNNNGDNQQNNGHIANKQQKLFICKPPASARGQGIDIVSSLEELHVLMSQHNSNTNGRKPKVSMVVQEYIANPCLLHNDAKFDLRVYVLITSILPLRVYIYDEGLVRFAANRYSKNIADIKNQFIHLTNYSVNKNCVEYVPSSSIDSQDGHKWTLKTLWKYLSMTRNVDVEHIWEQIIDLIIKTVISAESNILTLLKQNLKNPHSCFELLGFDIMLDEMMKLWLIEVNITPSLRADSVLDFSVKNQLVQDILNTLGYQLSPRFRRHYNFGHFFSPEKNDILTQMSIPNDEKHKQFEELYLNQGFDACHDLINRLTDEDVIHLMESEDEFIRRGQFRRIFPAPNSRHYLKYFEHCHYYNLMTIAWEERYHLNRQAGIDRLCRYMLQKDMAKLNIEKLQAQLNELERMLASLFNNNFN